MDDTLLGLKAEFAAGAIPVIKDFVKAEEEGLRLARLMKEATDAGVLTQAESVAIGLQVTYGMGSRADAIEELTRRLRDNADAQGDNNAHVEAWKAANEEAAVAERESASATREHAGALDDLGKAAPGAATGLREVGGIMADMNIGGEFEKATRFSGEFIDKLDGLVGQLRKYERAHGSVIPPAENLDRLMLDAAVSADNYNDKVSKLAEAQHKLSEETDPDKQYALEAAIRKAEQAVGDASVKMGDANKAAETAAGGTANYATQIERTREAIHNLLLERSRRRTCCTGRSPGGH